MKSMTCTQFIYSTIHEQFTRQFYVQSIVQIEYYLHKFEQCINNVKMKSVVERRNGVKERLELECQ